MRFAVRSTSSPAASVRPYRLALGAALVALSAVLATSPLQAQAYTSASRPLTLTSFATGGSASSGWVNTPRTSAFVFGGNIMPFRLPFVQPSLEVRSTFLSGPTVSERTLDGGLTVEKSLRRFRPYGDVQIGYGLIKFPKAVTYKQDNSTILSYGGGLDFQVTRSFSARADLQMQSWNLGPRSPAYTSNLATVGISYRPLPSRYIVR